jgi:cobalt/nickel transport system permease protein
MTHGPDVPPPDRQGQIRMRRDTRAELGELDQLARQDTPVHRLDPRTKLLVVLVYIGVVLSFPRQALAALTPLLLFPAVLLGLGQIPLRALSRKIAVALPFVLAVGLANPLLDRASAAVIGPVSISGGWLSLASILLRFVLTAATVLALVACTGMQRLGAAMQQLGVPRVLVVQVLLLHRYLFVIADEALAMRRGATLRAAGRALPLRVYGPMAGHLLLRAMDRADRVNQAMLARGFDGRVRLARPLQLRGADAVFAAASLLFFLAARQWNLAGELGRLVAGGAP